MRRWPSLAALAAGAGCSAASTRVAPAPEPAGPALHAVVEAQGATSTVPPPPPAPPPPPTRVVIISEDGLAADALDPSLAPTHAAFAASGLRARVARTVGPSETLPTHSSMLSGFPPDVHGMTWDSYLPERGFIDVPTLFSVAHDHGLSTAMLVAKPKLQHLARPGSIDLFERPGFPCDLIARRAVRLLAESPPIVTFLHFANADDAGHGRGWRTPAYQAAVTASDACVATVLAALDDLGLASSTYVFVTADHGGIDRAHSANDDRVRLIPWMVRGPGVPAGEVLDAEVSTMDTAATAMAVLGLPMPDGMVGIPRLPGVAQLTEVPGAANLTFLTLPPPAAPVDDGDGAGPVDAPADVDPPR